MALSKTVQSEFGLEITDAYIRVENLSLTAKDKMIFQVRFYVDPAKSIFQENQMSAAYDINGENPIKQAYLYLKTLPEFSDAIDA